VGSQAVRSTRRSATAPWPLALTLGLASWSAGLIHLAFMREHFAEYVPFGAFFLLSGVFQLVWAVMVFKRRTPTFFLLGLVANAAFAVLWAVTRTVGLPIGPEHWTAEAVGAPDVTAKVLEALLVAGCGWMLLRGATSEPEAPPAG
jgi:hypothetical protein